MSQAEIARMFGVTRQYVSLVKYQGADFSRSPREEAMAHYPWKVGARFNAASPDKRMRDHAEFMVTGGKGMSATKLKLLASFYRRLRDGDLVVEFDPSIPPSPGISTGGYAYRPRVESDGDFIIRVNEHTRITPEGRMMWQFPSEWPQVDD
jgi:hypothetical protein